MKVGIENLRDVTRRAIAKQGYDAADTEIILEIIMYAQLRGNNQNVIKLLGPGMPANPAAGRIRIAKETKLSALLDGGWNQGMVVMSSSCQIAIEKAREHGFGIVGTRMDKFSHWRHRLLRAPHRGCGFAGLCVFGFAGTHGALWVL